MKHYENHLKEYLNPMVIFAYAMFVGTTFLSIIAYRGIPLSMGPILEATSYIYVTIFGVKIFHERLNKKKIIALAMSAVMAVGMIAGCGSTNNSGTDTAQTESTEKVTPTFMYFVANADDNFDATNTMYTELENEYKDKINFQLVNVDENPEALENFSLVKDQTPALIMLDTSNNISAIEFKCSDKDKLKTDIDNALGK